MWYRLSGEKGMEVKEAEPDHGEMACVRCQKLCLLLLTCTPFSMIDQDWFKSSLGQSATDLVEVHSGLSCLRQSGETFWK